jgi:hypothetical protein
VFIPRDRCLDLYRLKEKKEIEVIIVTFLASEEKNNLNKSSVEKCLLLTCFRAGRDSWLVIRLNIETKENAS